MRTDLAFLSRTARVCVVLTALVFAGCASVRTQDAFDDARATLDERMPEATARHVVWRTGGAEDAAADRAVDSLLAAPLTAEAAVQVALLESRALQATYATLGVAQADLVQAGLLANPVFGGGALWPLGEAHAPALHLSLASSFLDLFYRPLRKAVAGHAYEAARLRVAEAVLAYAAQVRGAFYRTQAATAQAEMLRTAEANAAAAYEAAVLLREAGNVPAVDVLAEQARYEQVRLQRVQAEADAAVAHEDLAAVMGVFGPRTVFTLADALPLAPDTLDSGALGALEVDAVAASLALAAAEQDVLMQARRLGLEQPMRYLPDLELGAEAEREDGGWKLGPTAHAALPLFDQRQARVARAQAMLWAAQARYYDRGVQVRAAARATALRLAAAHEAARHYQRIVLPLHADLVAETLRQYNAMQTGVFGLLQAQQAELDAGRRYLAVLAGYWQARTDAALLRAGGLPSAPAPPLVAPSASAPARADAH